MSGKPIGFWCTVRWKDEPDGAQSEVFIAQTVDMTDEQMDDHDVFYCAGDYPESAIRSMYSLSESPEDWYIVEDDHVS